MLVEAPINTAVKAKQEGGTFRLAAVVRMRRGYVALA